MVAKSFKNTEIGVIPEDWEVVDFGVSNNLFAGFSFKSNDVRPLGARWLKIANVSLNKIVWDEEYFLPNEFLNQYSSYKLEKDDVVVALTRPILGGKLKISKISEKDLPCLLNQRVAKLVSENDTKFIYHFIQSEYFIGALNNSMLGTDPPNLSIQVVRKFPIPLPPIPEQKAIAEALSDADAWIANLEQMIAKKRLIKQGAMQQLLTPPSSSSGQATEDWEVKKLGEIGSFLSTNSLSRDDLNYLGGQIYNIHYGDIHTRFSSHFKLKNEFVPFINEASIGNKKYSRCQVGDLIIADASENEADIGKAIEVSNLDEKQVVSGLHTIHYRPHPKTFSLDYLGHLWQSKFIKEQILKEAQGTKVLGISVSRLRDLKIQIVSLTEQTRIATILSDMDSEIESLESQLAKARQIKQGMMQELLTGRVRLV